MSTATVSKQAMQQEALSRAASGQSWTNYAAIIEGFVAKGIPAGEISPRENVFTYHAWRALGRQVRRGEHGVKVITYIPAKPDEAETDKPADGKKRTGKARPWSATVFHISQTDRI